MIHRLALKREKKCNEEMRYFLDEWMQTTVRWIHPRPGTRQKIRAPQRTPSTEFDENTVEIVLTELEIKCNEIRLRYTVRIFELENVNYDDD